VKRLKLKAILNNFESFMDFISAQLISSGIDNYDKTKILTGCEEIIINITKYAYDTQEGELEIEFEKNSDTMKITFSDSGKAFNPLEKPDTDITLSLEEREVGGLGIFMVKQLLDDIQYEYKDNKNRLTIIKRITEKFVCKEN